MKTKKYTFKVTVYDLLIIGLMAATATALKPILAGIVHTLKASLNMPGGTLVGGIYMLPIVIGKTLSRYNFTGFFIGLVQALLMIVMGAYGTNGPLSLISFSLPGLVIDLIYFLIKNNKLQVILSTALGNLTGLFIVLVVLSKLPFNIISFYMFIALLTGVIIGYFNFAIVKAFKSVIEQLHLNI